MPIDNLGPHPESQCLDFGYHVLFKCTLYPDPNTGFILSTYIPVRHLILVGILAVVVEVHAVHNTQVQDHPVQHLNTHKQNARDQCCGSVTFWYGSIHRTRFGAGSDSGSRSCYFRQRTSRRLTKTYFFNLSFSAFYFLKLHLHYFTKIKSY